ncbi:hypothetical protein [Mesorhizobium sp. GbtcB19]|uniref:hypothetical protein n=1 Tax=Mesorhizobium sp. GbtcB19 TaxID=2824764 RepID=UPI001C2FC9C1|nr:hypothetical protein [Mesorhizobium sp. GbtcB19]
MAQDRRIVEMKFPNPWQIEFVSGSFECTLDDNDDGYFEAMLEFTLATNLQMTPEARAETSQRIRDNRAFYQHMLKRNVIYPGGLENLRGPPSSIPRIVTFPTIMGWNAGDGDPSLSPEPLDGAVCLAAEEPPASEPPAAGLDEKGQYSGKRKRTHGAMENGLAPGRMKRQKWSTGWTSPGFFSTNGGGWKAIACN